MKRLMSDLRQINDEQDYRSSFSITPCQKHDINEMGEEFVEDDMFHWKGCIYGPDDTPYQAGKFDIDLRVTINYPLEPPTIKFLTRIYHPNISENGLPCLSILRSKPNGEWTAAWTIGKTLLALRSLLATPNPDDPLNAEAARLYKQDHDEFYSKAQAMTLEYALPELY
jgi:ubiquitin-protein ligase